MPVCYIRHTLCRNINNIKNNKNKNNNNSNNKNNVNNNNSSSDSNVTIITIIIIFKQILLLNIMCLYVEPFMYVSVKHTVPMAKNKELFLGQTSVKIISVNRHGHQSGHHD